MVVILSVSCKSTIIDSAQDSEVAVAEVPKMAFITYKISKNQEDKKSIELINLLKVDGKFKIQDNQKSPVAGDYELIQLDKDGKQLATAIVENPLNQTVEYVNDAGEFAKKNIDFQSKETSIRVQLNSKTYYILLQEIGNQSKNFLKTKM